MEESKRDIINEIVEVMQHLPVWRLKIIRSFVRGFLD